MVLALQEAGLPSGQGLEYRDDSFVATLYNRWFSVEERAQHEVMAKVRMIERLQKEMADGLQH